MPKQGLLPVSPASVHRKEICHPIGNKQAGFSPLKLDCSEFCVRIPIFWKYVFKSAQSDRLPGPGWNPDMLELGPDCRSEPFQVMRYEQVPTALLKIHASSG